jgi:hypothetical protein
LRGLLCIGKLLLERTDLIFKLLVPLAKTLVAFDGPIEIISQVGELDSTDHPEVVGAEGGNRGWVDPWVWVEGDSTGVESSVPVGEGGFGPAVPGVGGADEVESAPKLSAVALTGS